MRRASAGAARRYARALLDVARDKGDPAAVRQDLRAAVRTLAEHAELHRVLAHPAVPAPKKKAVAAAVWGAGFTDLSARLLDLLIERGRVEILPGIEAAYVSLWNEERGVVAAAAVTAVPLSGGQEAALTEAIGRAAGKGVELAVSVDSDVLGGVLVRMGGRIYDGTVRTRLRTLRERLLGAASGGA